MPFSKKPTKTAGDESTEASPSPPPSPAHYRIPDEAGYFPAGADDAEPLVAIANASVYRIHPPAAAAAGGGDRSSDDEPPLATGTLTLRDPAPGTADDVALIGRVGDLLCYVLADDATARLSDVEFGLMLPDECVVVDLDGSSEEERWRVEALLAARTKFCDETAKTTAYPEALPTDSVSRALFFASSRISKLTVSAAGIGASKIEAYGEKKKEGVTETKEVKVGRTSILIAKGTRTAAEATQKAVAGVSDKISDVLGGKVGDAAVARETDGAAKRRGRNLLLASALSYAEVSSGAAEGYELMVRSAQEQATTYVAKRYGADAAELARHTAGAAVNFGRAALTAQRVVNVKKLVKTAAKQRVKVGIQNAVR